MASAAQQKFRESLEHLREAAAPITDTPLPDAEVMQDAPMPTLDEDGPTARLVFTPGYRLNSDRIIACQNLYRAATSLRSKLQAFAYKIFGATKSFEDFAECEKIIKQALHELIAE